MYRATVHDRDTGTTERISVSTAGKQGNDSSGRPSVDGDGNLIAFDSNADNLVGGDTNQQMDVFVRDRAAATTTRVDVSSNEAQGDGSSNSPSISDDGRYVAFISTSSNLVANDTNGTNDVFVRDLVAGTAELDSVSSDGVIGNSSSTFVGIGGPGADTIIGGPGADMLSGAGGPDVLRSNDGAPGDVVKGGPGRDRCVVDSGDVTKSCEKVVTQ